MSTSLLYHAFGVRGYDYVRNQYLGGEVIFTIQQPKKSLRCPACGAREVGALGHAERNFLSLPIGRRSTIIILPIPRVFCRNCGLTRHTRIDFADPRRTYTKAFERYALLLISKQVRADERFSGGADRGRGPKPFCSRREHSYHRRSSSRTFESWRSAWKAKGVDVWEIKIHKRALFRRGRIEKVLKSPKMWLPCEHR